MLVAAGTDPVAPAAGELRTRLRQLRRQHHTTSLSEKLTDMYIVVLVVGTIGLSLVGGFSDFLGSPGVQQSDPARRWWLAVAAGLVAAGLAWHGLRSLGPLLVSPATPTWVVSAPVDRRAWLLPQLRWLLVGAASVGALLGLGAALSGSVGDPAQLGWWSFAGASCGGAVVAISVAAQGAGSSLWWARRAGTVFLGTGGAVASALVLAHHLALPIVGPPVAGQVVVAVVGLGALPLAVAASLRARRSLAWVDRASLSAGTQLFGGVTTAAVLLDPSALTEVLAQRRWLRIGRVRHRAFRPAPRLLVLLQAELRRLGRRPGALAAWGMLLLAMYAVGAALPSAAPIAQILLAFLAGDRLAGGLRTVSRSAGLRRVLGGSETELRLVHFVVPALGTAGWFLLSLPAVPLSVGWLDGVLLLGVVVAVYRFATRRLVSYSGAVVDTPAGLMPVDIMGQLLRGLALLAVLVFVQALHL
ncbi:hypothetical protein JQS43_16670 [Natronosporangium hydrolyticum]|uniref:Uncharacterized protein n=1 Tax=Natronosporangium hydrolyticum TaxID=2811111 RepID=A0A895YFE2_9ACTN|nr:DUF6297 family protein [Natronosporangium hydrolyticum]QSB13256.1 hypothetical protein JQS43_16670 [Natronosporangium hydrolyticum]